MYCEQDVIWKPYEAADALREALAQPQGEPQLKRERCPDCNGSGEYETGIGMFPCDTCGGSCVKYSLTVVPQGGWVEIVDDDVLEVMRHTSPATHPQLFARAIIAKFKEKNTPPVVPQGEPVAYAAMVNGEIAWDADYPFSNEPFTCFDDEQAVPLYTTPPSVEAAIEDKGDYTEGYEEGWKYGALDMKEKAAKVCDDIGFEDNGYGCAAAIRSMK